MKPVSHRAGAFLRIPRRTLVVSFCLLFAAPPIVAGTAYFENPPQSEWGVLGPADFVYRDMAATPDGGVVMLGRRLEEGGSLSWPGVIRIAGDPGAVVDSAFYPALWPQTHPERIIPVLTGAGSWDGFLFVGGKSSELNGTYPTWMWLVRTDLDLDFQWETLTGRIEETGHAYAVANSGTGFLVGGRNAYLAGGGGHGWHGEYDATGHFAGDYAGHMYALIVHNIEPAAGGGYFYATEAGVERRAGNRDVQWRAGSRPETDVTASYSYTTAKEAAAGHIYGLANRNGNEGQVVVRFSAVGDVEWAEFFPSAGLVHPVDLVPMPDGGVLLAGTRTNGLNGGTDLWLQKHDATGAPVWEMSLGEAGDDHGLGIARLQDGGLLVAGTATVDGVPRTWAFKMAAEPHPVTASFTISPVSPVFRDQEVSFDASGSVEAPGDPIATYHWDFGDGRTDIWTAPTDDPIRYGETGEYTVSLQVLTRGSVASPVVEMKIKVVGLQIQWQRFIGENELYLVNGFVEARDGGFVLVGAYDTSYSVYNQLWVYKTDHRGRRDWDAGFDLDDPDASEVGRAVVQAHDTGYLIAGDVRHAGYDAVLQKIDEDGNPLGEMQQVGDPALSEGVSCLIPTAAGGYAMLGTKPVAEVSTPWLVEIAADLSTTEYTYPLSGSQYATWLAERPGGGYAMVTEGLSAHGWLVTTTAAGGFHRSAEFDVIKDQHWIGVTGTDPEEFMTVGRRDHNIVMRLHDADGVEFSSREWAGTHPSGSSSGRHAVRTLDGGHLITGKIRMADRPGNSLVLIKTDATGVSQWRDVDLGDPDRAAEGLASIALDDGSYVVLGRFPLGTSRCWLFKIAANHPPVADLQVALPVLPMGSVMSFDATGSTDRDGTVVGYEWDFGDGPAAGPGMMDHLYTEPGGHEVEVTVIDNVDGEDVTSMTIFIWGARVLDGGGQPYVIGEQSQSEDPGSEPGLYPKPGSPPLLDWDSALGFHLAGSSGSSTTRTFQVTFAQEVTADFTMYRLPDWTPVPFTLIDPHTVEVRHWTPSGDTEHTYVFSGTLPPPQAPRIEVLPDAKLSLSFQTIPGLPYTILHSADLDPAGWSPAMHGTAIGGPFDQEVLTGIGGEVTVYLEQPDAEAYYRLQLGEE